MPGLEADAIAATTLWGGAALFLLAALPALLRRGTRKGRRAPERLHEDLRPFGGRAFVIDGDTLVVDRVRVRLSGIDAPEMLQPGGPAARLHLIGLIGRRRVHVLPVATDIYGRTVAAARCEGRDLSHEMVRAGFARAAASWSWAYLGTELAARRARRGLWAQSRFTGISDPARHRQRQALDRRLRR